MMMNEDVEWLSKQRRYCLGYIDSARRARICRHWDPLATADGWSRPAQSAQSPSKVSGINLNIPPDQPFVRERPHPHRSPPSLPFSFSSSRRGL